MRIVFDWAPESRKWLETMPAHMDAAMRNGVERGSEYAARRGQITAARQMPKFEGWAAGDLRPSRGSWDADGNLFETFIGFIGDRTLVSETDTVDAPAPFHYPWAKHTPGA